MTRAHARNHLEETPADVKLSVVVGTFNRLSELRICLSSIQAQTRTPHRIFVTDGGSTDGTVEYLQSIASDTVVPIFGGKLVGQAKAYNDVFELVATPYVCWLSDDEEVVNGGLDVAVRTLDRHPSFGMVALKMSAVYHISEQNRYLGAVSPIGVLNVNQGLLRTDVLLEVGGFSEALANQRIDTDLTAKVLFSGHKIAYTKAVALRHHPTSEKTRNSSGFKAAGRNPVKMCEAKWAPYYHESRVWQMKRWLWEWAARRVFGNRRSTRALLGMSFFDWRNVLMGRYISLFDPLRTLGRPYHLVQSCPRRLRPRKLPPDFLKEYNGKVFLRLPRRLHAEIATTAELEGIGVNEFLVGLIEAGSRANGGAASETKRRRLRLPFASRASEQPRALEPSARREQARP